MTNVCSRTGIVFFGLAVMAVHVGCQESAPDPACCRLAVLSACDCDAISWVTGAEEAIASDDPATCQLMIDTILNDEGYASVDGLCEGAGDYGCYLDANPSCTSSSAVGGSCCRLAGLSACDCAALSYYTIPEEAIASGNQRTCRAVVTAVLDGEGYSSASAMCEAQGDLSCWTNAESSCR